MDIEKELLEEKKKTGTTSKPAASAANTNVEEAPAAEPAEERQSMEVDIACAGFGPAVGGFLTHLTRVMTENPEDPAFQSRVAEGMPLQVMCYERADDIAAGVSGVVTKGVGIRQSFPGLKLDEIPMAAEVTHERVLYLQDPTGASRRSPLLHLADFFLDMFGPLIGVKDQAYELPWTPAFLNKHPGMVLSIGQFNQWVGQQLMGSGLVQIWPGTPVSEPLIVDKKVKGLRLADQGVDKTGKPADGYMAGMDVLAGLTVVGDGPVGQVGRLIDERIGMPKDHGHREWALGMKFVLELPEDPENPFGVDTEKLAKASVLKKKKSKEKPRLPLEPGTVWHTFGYPEPEIFGFMYVHPERLVSVGIFVPSWMPDPARTAYRYLRHYIQHPAIWPYLKGATLRSWGAKSLEESGLHGEPYLVGDGYARIGEGSGSTNLLTGSGVDEAWTTGIELADAVVELLRKKEPFTRKNLESTYVRRRRASWVDRGARQAQNSRNGFHSGFVRGLVGMALAGMSNGKFSLSAQIPSPDRQLRHHETELPPAKAAELAIEDGRPLHDAILSARGWPEIPFDGRLLITHQDALLMGGKVQAMAGFADHVIFRDAGLCLVCEEKTCAAMCSGQAITVGADGIPQFEREKCIHCGACLWNCGNPPEGHWSNVDFRAGSGGLHSAEN
jgi:electron-transferring-flavoprotein dehydrogenase